ncbi:WecB/TagA/CpsF family glycosyltransferase [Brevibacillus humidisoli]|uniref:WecB/TagA/CpsF family glycosyltransferase n=1 Tax=Brevibacillus humidisoli TaxID=2895522 RepID=UPI001E50F8BF|nr:WecB/TagA/CpsF family glycosyltransferase [Brevibacillus humidisoli]UFJ43376.1 WecB/TagA/CpsF family glycosyltransferase [Brevibacillus humidisoli]
MQVAKILGVPFKTSGFEETVTHLTGRIDAGDRTHVVTANPEVVMVARSNPHFRAVLDQAYVVPDGIGIVYAARWLNYPMRERVTGIELMTALMERANAYGWSVYLLGASPDVIGKAASTLSTQYPQSRIVGVRDGYFCKEEEAAIVEDIAAKRPDLLFVALGSPRQDEWIHTYWEQIQVPLAMGVGGSFDVLAGAVKRAPLIWQKMHVEWLYRLISQPSRWRRQLAIPQFVAAVLREKWTQRMQS